MWYSPPNAMLWGADLTAALKLNRHHGGLSINFWFATIVVMVTFAFSGQALIALGQNYMLGSEPEKIHPATYFAALFLCILFFTGGQKKILYTIKVYPGPVLLIVSVLLLTVYVAVFLSVPAAGLPDTWLLPAMTFVLCSVMSKAESRILGTMLDVFMAINSIVGIGEIILDKRVVPLSVASAALGTYIFPIEWRASAFLGHPLTASYTTGVYLLLLVFDGRVRPLGLRVALIGLHACALLAFGSRGAMVFSGVTLLAAMIWSLLQSAVSRKIRKDVLVYLALMAPVAIIGVPTVLASGLADRFLNRFSQDGGSAMARVGMLDMFDSFSWSDIVFGPPKAFMDALGARFKIGSGIESFWFGFLFTFGIVGCVIFMPSLFMFCRDLVRRTSASTIAVLLFFFACCSTSVSLSSRSLDLAYVVCLVLTGRNVRPMAFAAKLPRAMEPADDDRVFALASLQATPGIDRGALARTPTPLLR